MPDNFRIALLGLGNVGRPLLAHLADHPDPQLEIAVAADRTGLVWFENGVSPSDLLAAKRAGGVEVLAERGHHYVGDLAKNLGRFEVDAVVDLLPADYHDGGVSRRILTDSLGRGVPCITADKAPLALDSAGIFAAARRGLTNLEYTATVGGGLPVVPVLRDGLAVGVQRIHGILNGTTNYLLSRIEQGADLDEELEGAKRLGIAEEDPRNDLEGVDAAAKGVILHNTAFPDEDPLTIRQAERETLDASAADAARELHDQGRRLRSVTTVEPGHVRVAFEDLPADHPLVAEGATAIVFIQTEPASTLRLVGPGAGGRTTAYATLRDVGRVRRHPIRGLQPAVAPEASEPVSVP